MNDLTREYTGVSRLSGPILGIGGVVGAGYGEVVEIKGPDGTNRHGKVLDVSSDLTLIQVYEGTGGLSPSRTKVCFKGHSLTARVSEEMLGRVFDGLGRPIDGGGEPFGGVTRSIDGEPVNPVSRVYPREFIQTGISSIDGMNTLIRGQKLPIFSGNGLPHNELAAQIVRQA
ncbi:V-type ATP synthase subunit B, partial [bacterium]|nr:V-type ATP synthase subunit B [bacterium]